MNCIELYSCVWSHPSGTSLTVLLMTFLDHFDLVRLIQFMNADYLPHVLDICRYCMYRLRTLLARVTQGPTKLQLLQTLVGVLPRLHVAYGSWQASTYFGLTNRNANLSPNNWGIYLCCEYAKFGFPDHIPKRWKSLFTLDLSFHKAYLWCWKVLACSNVPNHINQTSQLIPLVQLNFAQDGPEDTDKT